MSEEYFHPPRAWQFRPREVWLVNYLLNARDVASKELMHDALYGDDADGGPDHNPIDVHVCIMRRKLRRVFGPDADVIETIWGRGYRISPDMREAIRAYNAPPKPPQERAA